jgi:hypothetical protein
VTFSSNIDRYITAISSNLKFSFSGTKSNYKKNIVNNSDLRKVKTLILIVDLNFVLIQRFFLTMTSAQSISIMKLVQKNK